MAVKLGMQSAANDSLPTPEGRPRFAMTVSGPIPVQQLGVTLVHEHLLIDLRHASIEAPPDGLEWLTHANVADIPPATLAEYSCVPVDNLVIADEDLAVAELRRAVKAGLMTIVDVTPSDIGRNPEALQRIAVGAGANLIMGCGRYCEIAYPEGGEPGTEKQILAGILSELNEGVAGTGIRPGIIGELGINGEVRGRMVRQGEATRAERRVLRAGGQAASMTGAPLTVHLPMRSSAVAFVIDQLEATGVRLDRISLSHIDGIADFAVHDYALDRGVRIHYDCFGMALRNSLWDDPGDERRLDWLVRHKEAGRLNRVMLSHDIWCKAQLHAFHGIGYDYILTSIMSRLRERGFSNNDLHTLLISGPAEFLGWDVDGAEVASEAGTDLP
jgi:phosphotriesterase-related protein